VLRAVVVLALWQFALIDVRILSWQSAGECAQSARISGNLNFVHEKSTFVCCAVRWAAANSWPANDFAQRVDRRPKSNIQKRSSATRLLQRRAGNAKQKSE
jgi:hypothetical protein